MSTRRRYLLMRLLLVLTLLATGTASVLVGQQPDHSRSEATRKTSSYAFVSPNTRENLTLTEAIAGLTSADEKRLIDETLLVACRLQVATRVQRAVGSWADGAENSALIRLKTDQATVRYAASWMGKLARQKSVLYFRRRVWGRSTMYVLLLPRIKGGMAALATELDSDGVANRTLVPRKKLTLIYVVDLKNELKDKVLTAARRLHARVSSLRGDGEFIGDDDREKAQAVFAQEITNYEVTHPRVRRACKKKLSDTVAGR